MSSQEKSKAAPTSGAETVNRFGSDHWIDDPTKRRPIAQGRGLFSGLQSQKRYTVEHGWAKRTNEPDGKQATMLASLWQTFWGSSSK
ncbi:hypothetical protein AJ80_01546 [Polytolypa hystricis UAMH7299]|uniref:Uncharacterized protein n=1 Tax=Polytolypa hystricis (strain UAMH7299) TaxID=1447883 RepID=A0A2B7Z0D5_POLH7|nr:hypothetical protein AJ80_01546 [Polytolypa hystricis UAMH7299]